MNDQLLFLGLLFDSEEEKLILENSKVGAQGAANTFQWALLHGLDKCLGFPVNVMSCLPVGPFPSCNSKAKLDTVHKRRNNAHYFQIGSWNLPLIKQISREHKVFRYLDKKLRNNPDLRLTVIVYSIYEPYVYALQKLKKKYGSRLIVCPIVTDLPANFGVPHKRKIDRILFDIRGIKLLKFVDSFDYYVLLTEAMKIPLHLENKPFIVMEGIANENLIPEHQADQGDRKKRILYTGTLHQAFGIKTLLKAFEMITDPDYILELCGDGDTRNEIIKLSEKDSRIHYHGYLAKSAIQGLQSQATVLINPREPGEEFTKYSFPSKTIEYMMSGTPLIMNKLPGVPEEYYEYVYTPRDTSAECLSELIRYVCELEPCVRNQVGQNAQEFIKTKKSSIYQAKRILKLIYE